MSTERHFVERLKMRRARLALSACLLAPFTSPAMAQTPEPANDAAKESDIVVTGLRSSAVATKLNVEVRDLPQSITFVSRETLDNLVITRVEDIAYTTIGIQPIAPYQGGQSLGFFSRGFDGTALLVNGFNAGVTGGYSLAVFDLATVERIEILRGPGSVLYGQGNPGGLVNLTTKKPKDSFGAAVDLSVGTDGARRGTIDITGGLTSFMSARLNAAIEDSDSFRDFVTAKRVMAAPSLTIRPTDDVSIDLDYVYDRLSYTVDRFLGSVPELVQAYQDGTIPLSRNLGEPWIRNAIAKNQTIRGTLDYRFAPGWTFRLAGFKYISDQPRTVAQSYPLGIIPGTTLLERDYSDSGDDSSLNIGRDRTYTAQLSGAFDTGPLSHKLLVSAENAKSYYTYYSEFGSLNPIDYLNPVYGSGPAAPANQFNYQGGFLSKYKAAYGQDLISFGEHWKLLLGLRYDQITSGFYDDARRESISGLQRDKKVTPRAGLIYRPVDPTTIYFSWARSFLPNLGVTRTGSTFAPQEGEAYEVGIKQELLTRKLDVTASIFQIDKSNILTADPDDPFGQFLATAGDARSRGFEVELDGKLSPEWSIRAGVGHINAKITKSGDPAFFPIGARLAGAPKWTVNLGSAYRGTSGRLEGLGLGFNTSYASKREFRLPNVAPRLDSYVKLDAFASYRFGALTAQVNVENIFNDRILTTNGSGVVAFERPRRLIFSISADLGSLQN